MGSGKECTKCGLNKPAEEFHKHNRRLGGLSSHCKDCIAARYREKMATDPEWKARRYARHNTWRRHPGRADYNREYSLRTKFGITKAQYDDPLTSQNGLCAGCLVGFPDSKRTHLDHCHDTGRVRGILCQNCNMCLGMARNSTSTLRQLARYLERDTDARSA